MVVITLNLFQGRLCKTDADPVSTGQHDVTPMYSEGKVIFSMK
jgi:hypothetical protein